MTLYPEIKTTQVEKNEIIKTSMNSYLLKTRISDAGTLLYMGGIDKYCIECQIDPRDSVGLLSTIEYDEKCSLTGKYERGTDTLTIMTLMIEHIQAIFPHVKQLKFDDYSYRECSTGSYIDLAYFYYAIFGKTWYMKKLGAYFMADFDKLSFERFHTSFQKSKETTEWAIYDRYVTTEHPLPLEQMQKIFSETNTWVSYFTRLRDELDDIARLCIYMQPWITTFIKEKGRLRFTAYTYVMDIPIVRVGCAKHAVEDVNGRSIYVKLTAST